MECAAICYASAQLMSLGGQNAKELCRICAETCEACGAECSRHEAKHCQECANVFFDVPKNALRWLHKQPIVGKGVHHTL